LVNREEKKKKLTSLSAHFKISPLVSMVSKTVGQKDCATTSKSRTPVYEFELVVPALISKAH